MLATWAARDPTGWTDRSNLQVGPKECPCQGPWIHESGTPFGFAGPRRKETTTPMLRRKTPTRDLGDMVAVVSKESAESWSVRWAEDVSAVEQAGTAATADSAKAFVEGEMHAITRLRWERVGEDWLAYRRSR